MAGKVGKAEWELVVQFAVGSAGVQCRKSEVDCQQERREACWSLQSAVSFLTCLCLLSHSASLSLFFSLSLFRPLSGCKSQLIIAGKANYRRHQLARPHGVSFKQGDRQQERERKRGGECREGNGERQS